MANLAVPYRHSRLSAVKVAGDPDNPFRFDDNATADELRAEIMKRLEILASAGLIDLQALPAPAGGIANQRPSASINRVPTGMKSSSRTLPISATQRDLFVSNSAGVDQCQSRGMKPSPQVDEDYRQAAAMANLAVPYRHLRLSAVKVAGDPDIRFVSTTMPRPMNYARRL